MQASAAPASAPPKCAVPVGHDALSSLRSATAEMHTRLDTQLPIAREDAGLADYLQHVGFIASWLEEIDHLRERADGWPAGWAEAQRGRRARIACDLAGAGTIAVASPANIAAPLSLPPGFGWGVAYVVEGSQLGGQMLYRRLRERLAPHGLQYLAGDGSTGQWPRFMAALRSDITTDARLQGALDGAAWAFASLTARFEHAGVVA